MHVMSGSEGIGLPFLALLITVMLRWCVSLHPYSGEGQAPMFGDYEAQRHWMEITRNVPLQDWYRNTSENDLMYWGLDYPPLTAYHSFLCGHVAEFVNPEFITLGLSHGYESYEHKLFMRLTVLVADLLIYIPAVYFYFRKQVPGHTIVRRNVRGEDVFSLHPGNEGKNSVAMYLTLLYPGLILIDHGHFQYNGISLGLTIAAVAAITQGHDLIGSALFCLSLNYKQMGLYHALPFFCFLLANCLPKQTKSVTAGLIKFVSLSSVVLFVFLIIWLPFLKDVTLTLQVLNRLFPLARGVFEDKVSNVWCCLNVIYKFRNAFTNVQMAKLCLVATLLAVLPSSIDMLLRPKLQKFIISLINSSLAFFLFSFQVHEKSILLAAIPVALYLPIEPLTCFWFLYISSFSMLPLLLKDGLLLAYIALTVFYSVSFLLSNNLEIKELLRFIKFSQPNKAEFQYKTKKPGRKFTEVSSQSSSVTLKNLIFLLFLFSLIGCTLLTVCSVFIKPPPQYPDLFPLLISLYSCAHFIIFFAYFNYKQIFILNQNSKLKSK